MIPFIVTQTEKTNLLFHFESSDQKIVVAVVGMSLNGIQGKIYFLDALNLRGRSSEESTCSYDHSPISVVFAVFVVVTCCKSHSVYFKRV